MKENHPEKPTQNIPGVKRLSPQQFLNIGKTFGLVIDNESGGTNKETYDHGHFEKPVIGQYKLTAKDEDPILFFDGNFFQKTVEMTEKSIRIKLFC